MYTANIILYNAQLVGDVTVETSVNRSDYQDAFEEQEESSRFDDGATDDFANMPITTPMDDVDDCAKNEYNEEDMDDEDLLVTSEINYETGIQ